MWIDYVVVYIEYLRGTIRGRADDKFAWVCPVCGSIEGPTPAWRNVAMITREADPNVIQQVSPLDETCTCCDVHYGVDDVSACVPTRTLDENWHRLRLEWLERGGWNDESIAQLANLDRLREEVLLWKQNAANNG